MSEVNGREEQWRKARTGQFVYPTVYEHTLAAGRFGAHQLPDALIERIVSDHNELEAARAQAGLAQRYREHLRLAVEAGVYGPMIDDLAWESWLAEADALTAGPTAAAE